METRSDYRSNFDSDTVLTVPMRNGNNMEIEEKKEMRGCSYRTYEEWKHCLELNFCAFLFVLTVPMRNGNGIPRVASCSIPLGSYRTYEEWKPSSSHSR